MFLPCFMNAMITVHTLISNFMFLPCFMNAMITVHTLISNFMFLPCFMNAMITVHTLISNLMFSSMLYEWQWSLYKKKYKNLIIFNNIQKYTITMVYYYYNLLFKILYSHVYNILATFQTN